MLYINRDKLLGCLKENHYTQSDYAKKLHISTTSFTLKLKGRQFTESEVFQIFSDFGSTIFLDTLVSKTETKK